MCVLTVLYPEVAVFPGAPASSFPPPPSARCSVTVDNNITVTPSAHINEHKKHSFYYIYVFATNVLNIIA